MLKTRTVFALTGNMMSYLHCDIVFMTTMPQMYITVYIHYTVYLLPFKSFFVLFFRTL